LSLLNASRAAREAKRQLMLAREQDPEFQAKMASSRTANLAKGREWTPERREVHRKRMIRQNADPVERERKAAALRQFNADPERKRARTEKRRQTIAERMKDPAYAEACRVKNRTRWTPEAREALSKKLKAHYRTNPKPKTAKAAKSGNSPEARSRRMKAYCRQRKKQGLPMPNQYLLPQHLAKLYKKLRFALGYKAARQEIAKIIEKEASDVAIQEKGPAQRNRKSADTQRQAE
jgi:hypothetical protein